MATNLPPEFARTEIDFETTGSSEPADVWVEETYTNKYNDDRAVLAGDTYGLFKEAGLSDELDWDTFHQKWNGDAWEIDADNLDDFEEEVEEYDFVVDVSVGESDDGDTDALRKVFSEASVEASISVVYGKKNGNGTSDFEGKVSKKYGSEKEDPTVQFVRSDNQTMHVKKDKYGKPALYTTGSHAPFVGTVQKVVIEP